MSALFITCEPMLWCYFTTMVLTVRPILMPLFVGIVLVLVLVLEATVLETSLLIVIIKYPSTHL